MDADFLAPKGSAEICRDGKTGKPERVQKLKTGKPEKTGSEKTENHKTGKLNPEN